MADDRSAGPVGLHRVARTLEQRPYVALPFSCAATSIDGRGGATLACVCLFEPLIVTLDGWSVGFSTRREEPSNSELSSIDRDLWKMSPSTAPPPCRRTRSARIVPLTRPQIVTSWATTLPSTSAPWPIVRSEARSSPSTRPKIWAGPLQLIVPTIVIPEPMHEAGPAFGGG